MHPANDTPPLVPVGTVRNGLVSNRGFVRETTDPNSDAKIQNSISKMKFVFYRKYLHNNKQW